MTKQPQLPEELHLPVPTALTSRLQHAEQVNQKNSASVVESTMSLMAIGVWSYVRC